MKNKIISSAYSALRNVVNTSGKNNETRAEIKARNRRLSDCADTRAHNQFRSGWEFRLRWVAADCLIQDDINRLMKRVAVIHARLHLKSVIKSHSGRLTVLENIIYIWNIYTIAAKFK